MTASPDPAAVAAAERDHAARLYAEHQAAHTGPCPCGHPLNGEYACLNGRVYGPCDAEVCDGICIDVYGPCKAPPGCCDTEDCDECASLALHAERTARQAELLTPGAETGEMF